MERIKYSDGYLALEPGYNDDRLRFIAIMDKRRARIKLSENEKMFARDLCTKGKAIRLKQLSAGFERMFTVE